MRTDSHQREQLTMSQRALAFVFLVFAITVQASVPHKSFKPGKLWLDIDGNRIRAHSAGLLQHAGLFYWYGADSYIQADGSNKKINVYTSADLYNWNNSGAAFDFDCKLVNATACYVDRPKVIYNDLTQTFVMWMKSTPWTAVATASTPTGPFTFHSRFYPNGERNGDVTAFVDPASPADAYWLYSIKPDQEKRVIRVSKMTPEWTALTGYANISSTISEPDEAPAAFYLAAQKRYLVWTSHCSGWRPNAALLHSSSSLDGKWTAAGNPTHNQSTYDSQSTYILPVATSDGRTKYIYIADRFEPYITGPESGRYVWLPLTVAANGTVRVQWHDEWTLADL